MKPFTYNNVEFIDTPLSQAISIYSTLIKADKVFDTVWLGFPTPCKACYVKHGLNAKETFFFTVFDITFDKLKDNEHGIICLTHGIISDKK